MRSIPGVKFALAIAATAFAVFLTACVDGGSSFESDPAAVKTANELSRKMDSGAKLTTEEFASLEAIRDKHPESDRAAELYEQALIQREDWPTLEKLLTNGSAPATEEDRLLLGKVYMKLGKYAEARDVFAAMDSPPDAERASMLASAYFHTGDNAKAAETLDSVWPKIVEGKVVDGLVLRGLLHFYAEENEKAIEVLDSVISIDPASIPAHNALSRIYAKSGNKEKADYHVKAVEEAYKALTEKTGQRGRMVDRMVRLQEAYKAGRHNEVIELATELADSADPRNRAAIYSLLANSYRALGMNAEARDAAEKARQLTPK